MSEISATVSDTAWVADTSRTVWIISATIRFVGRELWRVPPSPLLQKGGIQIERRRPRSRATHGGSSEDFVGEEAPEARTSAPLSIDSGSLAPLDS